MTGKKHMSAPPKADTSQPVRIFLADGRELRVIRSEVVTDDNWRGWGAGFHEKRFRIDALLLYDPPIVELPRTKYSEPGTSITRIP